MSRQSSGSINRNITRIEASATGYEVRIMRRGQRYNKFFSDSLCGGKRKALQAAREFRDQLIEDLADQVISRKERAQKLKVNNYSGVAGVRYVEETECHGDRVYTYGYWEAAWCPKPGERRKRRFSVKKYGNDEAMKRALKARSDGVASMVE
ncbi:MAG: AP2 domain-containing protein [Planctomycetaceae bacterium]